MRNEINVCVILPGSVRGEIPRRIGKDVFAVLVLFGRSVFVKFENCSVEVSLFRDQQDGYRVGFIAGRMTNAAALNNFAGLEFVNCELNITREGFAKENNVNVYVGEDGYKGVFGMIADGASFTVPADKLGITINIDNNKD